jgi:hypothetical protein
LIEPSQSRELRDEAPELSDALAIRHPIPLEPEVVDPWEELEAAQQREQDAHAEAARLRARITALESWLAAGAADRRIEHLQAQRLLLIQAARSDRRWRFVLSLPFALSAIYVAGVAVLVWALLLGRL